MVLWENLWDDQDSESCSSQLIDKRSLSNLRYFTKAILGKADASLTL